MRSVISVSVVASLMIGGCVSVVRDPVFEVGDFAYHETIPSGEVVILDRYQSGDSWFYTIQLIPDYCVVGQTSHGLEVWCYVDGQRVDTLILYNVPQEELIRIKEGV